MKIKRAQKSSSNNSQLPIEKGPKITGEWSKEEKKK
jgi:hypothetical protein